MVHKNYKWNIPYDDGKRIVFNTLKTILQEKNGKSIQLNELVFLLNNRTKGLKFFNNNKKKNITNFIKTNFGGIIQFLHSYDEFLVIEKKEGIFIKLNIFTHNHLYDWVFVENI